MTPTGSVLGPCLGGFERCLRGRGYLSTTIGKYLVKCQTFDSFLVQRGVGLASLDTTRVEEFVADTLGQRRHRDERAAWRSWIRPLRLLWEYLQGAGLAPTSPPPGPSDPPLLVDYLGFLREHRGVCEQTVEDQQRHLRRFRDHLGETSEPDALARLSVAQVDGFLVERSRHLSRPSINSACAALRGFLRYLHMRGLLERDLAGQVSRPRLYSLATLPRAIEWRDVERTVALADRRTLVGCRDYAMLVLLAYCGLRAGEVARLRLEDLDWSHDTIHLHRPKRRTIDLLPLVPLVGEALVDYLRRRPASSSPQVFLKVLAPAGPVTRPCITWMARKYLLRAGVTRPRLGAHTLRHSYAVRLLRQGFPLKTIGDALGHQHPQSTFIYTKAAVEDLRAVSLDLTEVLP